jgi:hypothetical protein
VSISAEEFLMGGGIPSAKFDTIGTTVSGTIATRPEVVQQTDLDTGEPKFWNDGKPMMQLAVTIQTELRDPEIPDDDGKRKFYVKAKLLEAVRAAIRTAGAKGLDVGGVLTVAYVADGEVKKRGHNPPKIYSATYQPPAAAQANAFLNGGPAPQWAANAFAQPAPGSIAQMPQQASQRADALYQAAQQQLAAQPASAPAEGAAWTPPEGMDPQQAAALAALTPQQRSALGYP